MINNQLLLIAFAIFIVSGCSTETWKRTGYETLQNVKAQQCAKEPSSEACSERESYNTYQDKLKDSERSKK